MWREAPPDGGAEWDLAVCDGSAVADALCPEIGRVPAAVVMGVANPVYPARILCAHFKARRG